ncbi:MAG: hypothetical protein ACYSW0_15725 [Planctomycetota bacterium]
MWWEQANDFSIKDLGPIAVGFAILFLAFVMYQCIRQVGGSWAWAGITIGASILIAGLLGFKVPIDAQIIQAVTVVALIIGLMALFAHRRPLHRHSRPTKPVLPDIKHSMADLYRERHLSKKLDHGLRTLRKKATTLDEQRLRAKAHQIRNGHIARLEETRQAFAKLPASAKKKASAELAAAYNQMIGIDTRLERLNKAVAENEKRIRELTEKAREYTAKYDHRRLVETLKAAEKLQHHNSKLIKTIEHTENKLSAIAKKTVKEVKQIEKGNRRAGT